MNPTRTIRILDPLVVAALRNESKHDRRGRYPRPPRKLPVAPAAWQRRRAEYLEEVGREEKPA